MDSNYHYNSRYGGRQDYIPETRTYNSMLSDGNIGDFSQDNHNSGILSEQNEMNDNNSLTAD